MSYAVRNDGRGWRAVGGPDDCMADEIWQAEQPLPVVDHAADKAAVLKEFREKRDIALARLNGIQLENAGNAEMVAAIMAAKQALLNAPGHASVTAAVGGEATEDALQVLYKAASVALYTDAPYAYTAFRAFDQ